MLSASNEQLNLPPKELNQFSQINSSPQPVGVERGAALANILKGYEDFTLDVSGKIISSNLEAVNVTGYEEWEAIGRHFSLFYNQQDKANQVPDQDLEKVKIEGRVTFSAWRVKKRNVAFWAQITLICLKEDDGYITGYKMILKDQTHRLISSKRAKRFRDEYLNLFNNPFIGIFKFKINDFKFLLLNEKANEILGLNKESKRFDEIFRSKENFEQFLELLNLNKKVSGFEFQVNAKSVEWTRIDCQWFESDGFVEGVITDITEVKKQMAELQILNADLDSFLYHASHDLRSPLSTLMGLINLVEFDTQIELKDYCNMMRERVNYLDELLKDMAAIAYNNKSSITVESIDFKQIILKLIAEYKYSHPNIEIICSVAEDLQFFSDKHRIQIIIKNLLLNALNHYNPHVHAPFIKVQVFSNDGATSISIKDNGRGIKDEQILQVFGMFYKISNEVKETGLGLYIAKLMVDKLRGRITVKSKIGTGTDFEIELPNLKINGHNSIGGHSEVFNRFLVKDGTG